MEKQKFKLGKIYSKYLLHNIFECCISKTEVLRIFYFTNKHTRRSIIENLDVMTKSLPNVYRKTNFFQFKDHDYNVKIKLDDKYTTHLDIIDCQLDAKSLEIIVKYLKNNRIILEKMKFADLLSLSIDNQIILEYLYILGQL